jgi:uncharacterized protein (DUF924 family)
MILTPRDVLDFWFEAGPDRWFRKDGEFDAEIARRFGTLVETARAGKCDGWADSPEGSLALTVVLDQFPRNIHRGSPKAFACDPKALATAKAAIARGFDMELPPGARQWLYMPFMHSEDMADQEMCIELCKRSRLEDTLPHAVEHADIIRRFGRFPHRNAVLGRRTTESEQGFLDSGGFAG